MLRFGCSRPKLAGDAQVSFLCLVFSDLHRVAGGILPYIPIPLFTSSSAMPTLLDGRVVGLFVQRRRLSGLRKGLSDGIVGVLLALGFGRV